MKKRPSDNEFYRGLNRRFDKRAAILRRFGFAYRHLAGSDMAVFSRRHRYKPLEEMIPASFVLLAPNRVWIDELAKRRRIFAM